MTPFLLDVNVLIALAWPFHSHHGTAIAWYKTAKPKGIRTCPLIQMGFVRISANPKLHPQAVDVRTAAQVLQKITELPEHQFWPDSEPVSPWLLDALGLGHRQVTDLYLIRLAEKHGGRVATLDRGLWDLSKHDNSRVELIA